MTDASMTLIDLLQKHDEGDFLRAVTEAVLQTLMEHDVEGMIGAGRYGPVPVLFRSSESDVRHEGDRIWQRYAARSSSGMRFASRSPAG